MPRPGKGQGKGKDKKNQSASRNQHVTREKGSDTSSTSQPKHRKNPPLSHDRPPQSSMGKDVSLARSSNDRISSKPLYPSGDGAMLDEDMEFRKTFGSRQIESNWQRYEGLDEEVEEINTKLGEDFDKLMSMATGVSAYQQMEDEKDWDPNNSDLQESLECFTIQADVLAAAINCVPMFERLNLSPEVFDKHHIPLLESCAQEFRDGYGTDMNFESDDEEVEEIEPVKVEDETVPVEEDTVLDDLLDNSPGLPTSTTILTKSLDTNKNPNGQSNEEVIKKRTDKIDNVATTSEASAVSTSLADNLEDWLDDVLDD